MCPPNCQCKRHSGHRHTDQSKARISAARRAHTIEKPHVLPEEKKCSKCGEVKPRDDYTTITRKLKTTGEVREYLRSWCKQCERSRIADFRERKREEGTWSEYARRQAESIKKDPERREHRRRYQREWSAAKRRREGAKANGGWKRYRDRNREALPIDPFSAWLAQRAERLGLKEKQLRRIIRKWDGDNNKEIKLVSLHVIDRIIIALDYPELLSVMYHDVPAVTISSDIG
jgi:uncharacterized protein YlaI